MNAIIHRPKRHRQKLKASIMALEPRIMFDGAAVADVADHVATTDNAGTDAPAAVDAAAKSVAEAIPSAAVTVLENTAPATDVTGARHEVVVVDTSVVDWQTLVRDLNPNIPLILLEPGKDGLTELEQMAVALSQYDDLDAIHLVAEGRTGGIILGQSAIWGGSLDAASPYLAEIGAALKPGGDFMLYSCSVAGGESGRAFIDDLSRAMGDVDIAASTDLTGPTLLGGDWDLEYSTGDIDTVLPFTLEGMQDISHCLGCTKGGFGTTTQMYGAFNAGYIYYGTTKVGKYSVEWGHTILGEDGAAWPDWNDFQTESGVCGASNSAPTFTGGANAGLTLSEDAAITTITTAMLEVKDAQQAAAALTYTIGTAPTKGTLTKNGVTLSAAGTFTQDDVNNNLIKYTPTANANGSDSFTFSVADGAGGTLSDQTFSITVNAVADTPSVTNSSTNEDTQTTSGLVISRNVVDGAEITHFKISNITGGTLYKNNGTTQITNNSFITYAEANAGLKFTPTANSTSNGSFDVQGARDSSGNGLSSAVTATITVAAINDDPTLAGKPASVTVVEDTLSNLDLSAVTFADVDSGGSDVVLTIAAAAGTLTSSSGGSVTVGGSGTGTITLTGTAANIDAFLNTATNVQYTGAANASGTAATTLTLSANDGGNTGSGGGGNVSFGTINVDITGVADTPSVTNASTTPSPRPPAVWFCRVRRWTGPR